MLGIIVVTYKSHEDTVRFITTELPKIKIPYKVVIVDNGATFKESVQLSKECGAILVSAGDKINLSSKVYLLNSFNNLGYAKGNNLGATFLIDNFNPQYLLISNDDIYNVDNEVIKQLIKKIEGLPKIAAIGPKIIQSNNGSISNGSPNPAKVKPLRFISWYLFLPVHELIKSVRKIKTKNIKNQLQFELEGVKYWISGCFMLLRTSFFCEVNMFDSNTFLYGEEMILSERLSQKGYKMYYYPEVSVWHKEHGAVAKSFDQKQKAILVFDSLTYYYLNYIVKGILWPTLFAFTKRIYFKIYYPIFCE